MVLAIPSWNCFLMHKLILSMGLTIVNGSLVKLKAFLEIIENKFWLSFFFLSSFRQCGGR